MKRLLIATLMTIASCGFAVAAEDKDHPPTGTMEKETPEMKSPEGTEKMHPPQKAMDEATPAQKKTDPAPKGASSSASAAVFPAWDTRKAGEGLTLSKK